MDVSTEASPEASARPTQQAPAPTPAPPTSAAGSEALLRVRASSSANRLAAAISNGIYDGRSVVLRAVGAGAVNQSMKAIAIARGFVAPRGIDLVCCPGFTTVEMPDGNVTALTIKVIKT